MEKTRWDRANAQVENWHYRHHLGKGWSLDGLILSVLFYGGIGVAIWSGLAGYEILMVVMIVVAIGASGVAVGASGSNS